MPEPAKRATTEDATVGPAASRRKLENSNISSSSSSLSTSSAAHSGVQQGVPAPAPPPAPSPPKPDTPISEELASRLNLLAKKHENDLYRCLRARVLQTGLKHPQNPEAVGLHLLGEDGKKFHVTLLDQWAGEWNAKNWLLEKDDVVHLLGDPAMYAELQRKGHCELSEKEEHQHRMLVYHPDLLFTGTAVSNALSCRRLALIKNEFQRADAGSKPLIIGNVVHSTLQAALANRDFSASFIDAVLNEEIHKVLVNLWILGVPRKEIYDDSRAMMTSASNWAMQYFNPLVAQQRIGGSTKREENPLFPEISKLVGNEQNVYSHRFGLNGKLDGLVRLMSTQQTTALEIKTGKQRTEHVGQITVYYLLLCDLVNQQVQQRACSDLGLLFYPHKGRHIYQATPVKRWDIHGIVHIRNELGAVVQRRRQTIATGKLAGPLYPPLLPRGENGEEPDTCKRCWSKGECYALNTALEKRPLNPSTSLPLAEPLGIRLQPQQKAYMQRWDYISSWCWTRKNLFLDGAGRGI